MRCIASVLCDFCTASVGNDTLSYISLCLSVHLNGKGEVFDSFSAFYTCVCVCMCMRERERKDGGHMVNVKSPKCRNIYCLSCLVCGTTTTTKSYHCLHGVAKI
ncbi:T. brucei spp.-specific protein [Trypanosoma brucei gambiense DAL972]|uniref:T. brucei spp.-specific protein n=1 Tax=Trypanosoma brucei gambiense (strain MHOM/CI/86/DAL972) TaxID=679716 RepID=C9ZM01_TRYB9|nr:T. brucei spp.-specific protein [Trypanosoma brucei gambiense DAL972]CBH10426.1 T. brucei spp.-specific protein [Trypanosoma brucei gambiense DAL972]|eukprot:XP_011772716.1 T. brucei spp.-specific protein [Trypanosoma brucei gambiense DAL972]